jgi:receptor protein-tyrosine kinase
MSLPRGRAHLVERAVEALAETDGRLPRPIAPAPLSPAALPPAPAAQPGGAPSAAAAQLPREPEAPPVITTETLIAAGMVAAPRGSVRSRVMEEMNLVQQQILRAMEEASHGRNRIVLVSSARPGEGKSFVSLNVASCMASNGNRNVVLVDADGRHGAVSESLGAGKAHGLCGLAAAPQERRAPLLATAIKRLFFLPFGQIVPGAGSRPSGAALADAITRLARAMPDHVLVLDTPPSLSTSDANALSAIAGVVVVVVDAERTQRNEVEAALDMMEACPSLQLLLNRTTLTANDSFGAYGDYGAAHAS